MAEGADAADRAGRADREMRSDPHMSDIEALMWNVEKDPHLSATFGNVTLLDRAPDLEQFRRRMQRAIHAIPRLRQRVVPGFGRLGPPSWQDDPAFDIDFHVQRAGLPSASERDLFDFAMRFAQGPFDRTRPLWEFAVLDGLPDGRGALVQKMHHTITDGVGGVRMSEQFIDLERGAPGDDLDAEVPAGDGDTAGGLSFPGLDLLGSVAGTAAHAARRTVGAARRTAEGTAGTLRHPDRWPAMGADGIETVRSLMRQAAVTDPAHSPLWGDGTLGRHLEVLSVPFDAAKRTARAHDSSINDVFVTGAVRAAGAYHVAKSAPVDELRMAMPVSTRSDNSSGGNSFAPSRVLVPVAIDHPAEHLAAVRDRLEGTKHERGFSVLEGLAGLVNVLPTSVLVRMARQQVETVDFTTSNVRGAPLPLYIAGGRIEANYPLGPVGGTAFDLTTLSYDGALDMGLVTDSGAVDDAYLLRDCLLEAFAELFATA